MKTHDHHFAQIAVDLEALRGDLAALGNGISFTQSNLGDLWRDQRGLRKALNATLSTMERRINELLQVVAMACLRRLE